MTSLITITGLIGPGVGTAQAGQIGPATPAASIEAAVLDQVADGAETTFWVKLDQQADLSPASAVTDWEARGELVYNTLTTTAESSQAGLRSLLDARGVEYRPFWIVNAIQVTGDRALVDELAARSEVAEIIASRTFEVPDLIEEPAAPPTINAVEWGVDRIGAPDVWDTFDARGEGIVVGIIDTGGTFDHPALVNQYRGNLGNGQFDHNYNWHDPSNVCGTPSLAPCDNHGHATHVTGTVLGDDGGNNQVGVAPAAKWIAAKGCEFDTCSDEALLSSGQFMLAPTDLNGQNPDPDLRPHIVNNSWGGDPVDDPWYEGIVTSWVAAGIFPQFANGNTLVGVAPCGSSSNPGNMPAAYAAGAFDVNNNIANFSNRGPSAWDPDLIKPNISAPGVAVRSSLPGGGYGTASGTSMASPHVAGAVALIWSAAPEYARDVEATRDLLDATAIDVENLTCGGTAENNNVWGQGRLDVFAAVSAALGVEQPSDPAIEVDPESLSAEQAEGEVTEQTLTIGNVGDGTLDWSVFTDEPQRLPTESTPVAEAGGAIGTAEPGVGLTTQRQLLGSTFGPPQVATPEVPAPAQDEITITHSASQSIVAQNSVACNSDRFTTVDNGYLRHFVLPDFDITSDFQVTEVSFGIEAINAAPHPVTVHLYTMIDPAGPFVYSNFQEIGSAETTLPPQALTIVEVPVT
ncbi:MAG TPA: S8 family serine peptidase, partial [Natronosporangium sp.]